MFILPETFGLFSIINNSCPGLQPVSTGEVPRRILLQIITKCVKSNFLPFCGKQTFAPRAEMCFKACYNPQQGHLQQNAAQPRKETIHKRKTPHQLKGPQDNQETKHRS